MAIQPYDSEPVPQEDLDAARVLLLAVDEVENEGADPRSIGDRLDPFPPYWKAFFEDGIAKANGESLHVGLKRAEEFSFNAPCIKAAVEAVIAGTRAGATRADASQVVEHQDLEESPCITHAELMRLDLPEPLWIVEGIIPDESLTVLGGKKKLGKSWMCLQLSRSVATGTPFLGRPTTQGPVLHLCLEDGKRRLRNRLQQQKAPADMPITYVTELEPLDRGGIDELQAQIREFRPRLVIIDTLAASKSGKVLENDAGPMADLVNQLRRLAQEEHVAILMVAHHGKTITGDPGHDIRGSSATPAAADVSLGLYRENGRHTLKGEGRDIEDFELAVAFDNRRTWTWRVVQDARVAEREASDERVIEAVRKLVEADAEAIAQELGRTRQAVQQVLMRLRGGALAHRNESGTGRILYRVAEPAAGD